MKNLSKVLFLMFLGVMLTSSITFAQSLNLGDILGYGYQYTDTNVEGFSLTDSDGSGDDATAFLLLETAGYSNENAIGLYTYDQDTKGLVTVNDKLQIFAGPDAPLTSATLAFDFVNDRVTNNQTSEYIAFTENRFGFYLTTPEGDGHTYYTHTSLNADEVDHAMVFNTSDNVIGQLFGSDIIIAFEDLFGGGDMDYDDLVFGISDIQPVPEPASIALLGIGLLGLAGIGRKKFAKK